MASKTSAKIVSWTKAEKIIGAWKASGEKIVFTNGCFDILHLGHIDYLEKSKKMGGRLIVGVNADTSVRIIKGPTRPINDEKARSRILAALEFVDLVVLFEQETPEKLIEKIIPDILIKGNDYSIENIVGAKFVLGNGGKVETVELVSGYSTTGILNKIKNE